MANRVGVDEMRPAKEFAIALLPAFKKPRFEESGSEDVVLSGILSLDYDGYQNSWEAMITIVLEKDWDVSPPTVRCHERWLRRELDWHVPNENILCWIYPEQWRIRLRELGERQGKKAKRLLATEWLLRNVRHLLTCHAISEEFGIPKWKDEWPQYAHNEQAEKQFLRDERKRKLRVKKSDGSVFLG
ncbi:MAG: hypothetical protein P1U86_22415 [Verrucomicrobiales bacterium]|nr:hypothetical protein [Verrucomicrobiales bacterium]